MLANYNPVRLGEYLDPKNWPLVGSRLIDEARYAKTTHPKYSDHLDRLITLISNHIKGTVVFEKNIPDGIDKQQSALDNFLKTVQDPDNLNTRTVIYYNYGGKRLVMALYNTCKNYAAAAGIFGGLYIGYKLIRNMNVRRCLDTLQLLGRVRFSLHRPAVGPARAPNAAM